LHDVLGTRPTRVRSPAGTDLRAGRTAAGGVVPRLAPCMTISAKSSATSAEPTPRPPDGS
jgi:hypothetical protein